MARAPASLAPLMRASRMAVASFGVSAFELAACGVPAVHVCLTADHARSSGAFRSGGRGDHGGVFGQVTAAQLAGAAQRLMGAAGRRGEMASGPAGSSMARGERVAALVAGDSDCVAQSGMWTSEFGIRSAHSKVPKSSFLLARHAL